VGCAGPISDPSRLMVRAAAPAGPPPAGKSLVCIHRQRAWAGHPLYTGVWDSRHFIADLGNGHSAAYLCDPGTHYFINRSIERVGVVEANLLPAQTYDLWLDINPWSFMVSFQLEPVKPGSEQRKKVPQWMRENAWMERGPAAAEHEQLRQPEIDLILHDFVNGDKKDRLRHLSAEDHR
jgi:hypothetical protein